MSPARDALGNAFAIVTLVEKTLAGSGAAEARDTVETANLALELVVVRQLLVCKLVSFSSSRTFLV